MARKPFTMRSGNNTSFKMMGSSPVKELVGNQDKIDMNKNGRIDSGDFDILNEKKSPLEVNFFKKGRKIKKAAEKTFGKVYDYFFKPAPQSTTVRATSGEKYKVGKNKKERVKSKEVDASKVQKDIDAAFQEGLKTKANKSKVSNIIKPILYGGGIAGGGALAYQAGFDDGSKVTVGPMSGPEYEKIINTYNSEVDSTKTKEEKKKKYPGGGYSYD
tara:strand:- start:1810 stop:2457 length:648 start_codon:yes stop_codon:yes gene_type:complete